MSDEDINSVNLDCCTKFVISWLNFCTGVLAVSPRKPSWLSGFSKAETFFPEKTGAGQQVDFAFSPAHRLTSPFSETLFQNHKNAFK